MTAWTEANPDPDDKEFVTQRLTERYTEDPVMLVNGLTGLCGMTLWKLQKATEKPMGQILQDMAASVIGNTSA